MFLEMDGAPLASERQTPADCIAELKEIVAMIKSEIFKNDGVVKTVLGENVVAFFGYDFTKGNHEQEAQKNHAKAALDSAIAIQRENIKRFSVKHREGRPVFPLRIGINTTKVHFGNLSDDSIDFTLVGLGIGHARKMKDQCEQFRILLGPSTKDLLGSELSSQNNLHPRKYMTHGEGVLSEIYECNPFDDQKDGLIQAFKAYKEFSGIERHELRWPLPKDYVLSVQTDTDDAGRLKDFSFSGFSAQLSKYYVKGTELYFRLDSSSGELKKMLANSGLLEIAGEVCWGRPDGKHFVHGFRIKNFLPEKRRLFLSILRQEVINISDRLL